MIDQLQRLLEQRVQQCVSDRQAECSKIERKKNVWQIAMVKLLKQRRQGILPIK